MPQTRWEMLCLTKRAMGLTGESWACHANPQNVCSRSSILALLTLAPFSRAWLGWAAMIPVAPVLA